MYSAVEIADHIVLKAIKNNKPVDALQLQGILYSVQRHFLGVKGVRLFEDDIEAWSLGPVVTDVYHRYQGYINVPIWWIPRRYNPNPQLKKSDADIVNAYIEKISKLNPFEMQEFIAHKGGAWEITYKEDKSRIKIIPPELILRKG